MKAKAVTVCVDYWDFLAITLPINRSMFESVTLVTASHDKETQRLAEEYGAGLVVTDLFYDREAVFNKWKALEYALDVVGRDGWICLLDADIVLPTEFQYLSPEVGRLYTPRRRMMDRVELPIPTYDDWLKYPLARNDREFSGYCQLFHATDRVLGAPPWHETNWRHAGGADSFFQAKWDVKNKIRPPFECLHLGEAGRNWCGRSTQFLDGTTPAEGQERQKQLRKFMEDRGSGPRRFEKEKYQAD